MLAGAQHEGPEKHQILTASIMSPTMRCCLLAQAERLRRWRPVTRPSTPVKNAYCECSWAPNLGPHFRPCIKDCIKRPQKWDPKADPKMVPRKAITVASKTFHSKRCPSSFWPTARRTHFDPHNWGPGPEVCSQVFGVLTALKKEPRAIPTICVMANPSPITF